ncbi:hypothetical protein GUJ93_ZPchr0009g111 [Zizania palustris]|uniref:Retrovirus-related Pol polyprotein from transposon TNT 1-94-like beta-barrel domain-containing protein n=1 Tax=Zizania palustris TaxID=103762 RepID=A0A8J5RZC2_ZIZPA|nr:hypothetical protein GUJ93_ZPchr0009g111 [Zizania palustris]
MAPPTTKTPPPTTKTLPPTTILEVDPADEDPNLLNAMRKRNSVSLTSILDPINECSDKDSSNANDAVWYLGAFANHITGNLNLLADLTPVYDRWVRTRVNQPAQVLARGSVNNKRFKLQDVWYVPECKVNVVSMEKLTCQELAVTMDGGTCAIKQIDGTLVGKGRLVQQFYELDFLSAISSPPCYIVSNVTEHMTGEIFYLFDFTSCPGRPVRTPTGMLLQVRGKGDMRFMKLAVPDVSFVPGLTENIISLIQLIDSGFNVVFDPDGCTVTSKHNEQVVGRASHAGGQLYRINFLRVAPTVPSSPVRQRFSNNHVSC